MDFERGVTARAPADEAPGLFEALAAWRVVTALLRFTGSVFATFFLAGAVYCFLPWVVVFTVRPEVVARVGAGCLRLTDFDLATGVSMFFARAWRPDFTWPDALAVFTFRTRSSRVTLRSGNFADFASNAEPAWAAP